MSKKAARVEDAIRELDTAILAYLVEEEQHGVPRSVSAESVLGAMSPVLVQLLLDHMPTLAHPWRVTDMRDGEPTKVVRNGRGVVLARVQRMSQGKRGRPRWIASVRDSLVSPPDVDDEGNVMPIDWSTMEEAQAACDAQLRRDGVTIVEVKP